MKQQAVVVSGSRGFLASRILNAARSRGLACYGIVRKPIDALDQQELSWELCLSSDKLSEWFSSHELEPKSTTFIHAATHFTRTSEQKDVEATFRSNVLIPMQYFEAMAAVGVSQFVNFRSTWEMMEPNPTVPIYAVSKRVFSDSVHHRFGSSIQTAGILIEESMGPFDQRDKLVPGMLAAQLAGSEFRVGHPRLPMNFAYSEELATFALNVFSGPNPPSGDAGFVTWKNVTPELIWRELIELTGSKSQLVSSANVPLAGRPSIWDAGVPVFGIDKLSLPQALEQVVNSYKR